jgi:hypothetical protein
MKDYLEVEYSRAKITSHCLSCKLAEFIFETFNLEAGKSFLEVGCGRCDLLLHFGKLRLDIYGIDSARSAANYASSAEAHFELAEFAPEIKMPMLGGRNLMSYSQKVLLNILTTHFPFSSGVIGYLSTGGKSFH